MGDDDLMRSGALDRMGTRGTLMNGQHLRVGAIQGPLQSMTELSSSQVIH
jgi:hypothetical protein